MNSARTFCVRSSTILGVSAVPVDVEVVVSNGLPTFNIVGMPDASIKEARERIRAAIKTCGFIMPYNRVVVNLAPGSLRKFGSGFDVPIAVAILAATGQIPFANLENSLIVGELSLDGSVRPVSGLLAHALCAKEHGWVFMCADEPSALVEIEGHDVRRIESLSSFRHDTFPPFRYQKPLTTVPMRDFSSISGHVVAKRALQIAAAGEHGVLMMGPPGSGKTMLASCFPSILPPLNHDEMMEAAVVHSVAGEEIGGLLTGVRPFRCPHHSASMAGLVGGGRPLQPGEITLAHFGVLFLDELSEFKPSVLQAIRQPLEEGRIVLTRAEGRVSFPARFSLLAASNPCPCGYLGDHEHTCQCTEQQVRSYQSRIGGPVLDRIDIHIDIGRLSPHEILGTGTGISSDELRQGVMRARAFASIRNKGNNRPARSKLSADVIASCSLSEKNRAFFEDEAKRSSMSGRGIIRTLSIARTIADMEESMAVERSHLCEALTFRLRNGIGSHDEI